MGAAGGALIGSQLASRGSKDKGAVLGALGGALLGGSIGNSQTRCPDGLLPRGRRPLLRQLGGRIPPVELRRPAAAPRRIRPAAFIAIRRPGPALRLLRAGRQLRLLAGARPSAWRTGIGFTESQVRRAADNGWLDRREARRAYADIGNVRRYVDNARSRNGGRLRPEDRRYVEEQLNYISQRVRWEGRN